MRFSTLDAWLAWQERLHPSVIDLGLERVAEVAERLGACHPAPVVITVAGTNGKGSTVALLEAILSAGGYRVGTYTSPHLFRYNERIHIHGREAGDDVLCEAFQRIDDARGDTSLTYFEFGTLAALDLFCRAPLDVVVLEVGMGGRLDATNVVDADVAVITTVDIDHTQFLGPDRETIAREKAGILRPGRPAVYGDEEVPESLREQARTLGATLYRLGADFGWESLGATSAWWGPLQRREGLPPPALGATSQWKNAATALMALELLQERLPLTSEHLAQGLRSVRLPGRFQVISGPITQVFDVAHNCQAAGVLAETLRTTACKGRTHGVVGMLADKEIEAVLARMRPVVDVWYPGGLSVERAAPVERLVEALASVGVQPATTGTPVVEAYRLAMAAAEEGDRVVVFGSFYSVAEVLAQQV